MADETGPLRDANCGAVSSIAAAVLGGFDAAE